MSLCHAGDQLLGATASARATVGKTILLEAALNLENRRTRARLISLVHDHDVGQSSITIFCNCSRAP